MIPVPFGYYKKIMFDEITDVQYKKLLRKEYFFCLKIKEKLLNKAEKLYNKQKQTNFVPKTNCNFSLFEKTMAEWIKF